MLPLPLVVTCMYIESVRCQVTAHIDVYFLIPAVGLVWWFQVTLFLSENWNRLTGEDQYYQSSLRTQRMSQAGKHRPKHNGLFHIVYRYIWLLGTIS